MTTKISHPAPKTPKDEKKIRALEDKAIALLRRSEELRAKAHELIRQSLQ